MVLYDLAPSLLNLSFQNLFYAPKQKTGSGIINSSGALLRAYYGFRREYAVMHDEDQEDSGNEEEVDNPPGMFHFEMNFITSYMFQ